MKSGLMWYMGQQPFDLALAAAKNRYYEKFGVVPNVAFLNPADAAAASPDPTCAIVSAPTILKRHIWLGVQDVQVD